MLDCYDDGMAAPITSTHISYDDHFEMGTHVSLSSGVPAKSVGLIPQLLMASAMILTVPTSMPPILTVDGLATISSVSICFGDASGPIMQKRKLSLREARALALRASHSMDELLRLDRERDARFNSIADDEPA